MKRRRWPTLAVAAVGYSGFVSVGLAAVIIGLSVGGTVETVAAVGGGAIGLLGLYRFLR